MNYFLVLSEISSYFQGVSSLDTKLIASAIAYDDECYDTIFRILPVFIPDYYGNNYRNDRKFGREEIEYEAKRRNFNYDVIEKTNGEDGNEECEISISIYGETFVLHTDKWKDSSLEVVLGEPYGLTTPKIYIDDMFDMFEELVQVKYALRGLMSIYMSIIGSSVDSASLKKALILQLFLVPILPPSEYYYSGLFGLVYLIQNDYEVGELLLTDEEAHSKNIGLIWSPEEFRNHCDEIVADCKRNLKVEQVASKNTAYALVQTAMEGFPRANDIRYTCFSNGTLLLAPYRKTGAIMGFVKYTELPRLNDIIRAIATFNDDQVDSLPEGFILLND
ncbi:MAG: hypothetical protein ACI3ZC_08215 [Candidatus Cryptobacteroides sp.]